MIVKIFNRGRGGGSGPVDYLLGKDRNRPDSLVLRGNAEETRAIIDASNYEKKYTSGVLSFEEADITPEQKRELMNSFEECLFTGLDKNQYNVLWVEHTDKGRLELNFVIPNVELTTGKRLQPYYHGADGKRVDAWRTIQNLEQGFTDPTDPSKRQSLVLAKDLPANKKEALVMLSQGVENLVIAGVVTNRQEVLEALQGAGFEIARQTKTSISIKDPDGGQNIRLKGAIYEQSFELSGELQKDIERAATAHQSASAERLEAARERYQYGLSQRQRELKKRYQRAERSDSQSIGRGSRGLPERAIRESAQNEQSAVQTVANRPSGDIDGRGVAVSVGRSPDHEHSREAERNQRNEPDPSAVRSAGGQDELEPVRRERLNTAMRPDRRESTAVSGRLHDNQGVLNDGNREAIARHIERIAREQSEATERFNRTLRSVREASADNDKELERFAKSLESYENRERANGLVERAGRAVGRAKLAINNAVRAAQHVFKQVVDIYKQQQAQERFKTGLEAVRQSSLKPTPSKGEKTPTIDSEERGKGMSR